MSDNIQKIDASVPSSTDNYKRPLLPYVLDFVEYISGFTLIIIIALVIIHVVSAKIT